VARHQIDSVSGPGDQALMHGVMAQAQRADVVHSDRNTMRAWERFPGGRFIVVGSFGACRVVAA
jgi:hypothetical protein